MKWLLTIHYNSNRRKTRQSTRSGLLNILNFILDLPLGSWRDIESLRIERLH